MSIMRVSKAADNNYGRTKLPASGHVTHTAQGNLRITPSGNGIPAQALVEWNDHEVTWERLKDLHRHTYRKAAAP